MNGPIRTIVLDDKPLIRKAIVQHVDWHALNCAIVGEAGNGVDGMRLVDECKPDLMVTDIRMPGCDGLELAEYMKRVVPDSRVILITGHQEFEYARRAVTVGAFDFILKPICYAELQRIIAKAAEEILQKRRQEEERLQALQASENYERDFRQALPFLRSKLVADYIAGQSSQVGGLTGRAELLEFQWFMLVHCRLRQFDKAQDKEQADSPVSPALTLRQTIAAAGGEWVREAAAAGAEAVQAAVGEELVLVLMLKHSRFNSKEQAMAAATACAAHWERMILNIVGREGSITASSSLYGHPSQLKEAFAETARQLDAYFFAGFTAGAARTNSGTGTGAADAAGGNRRGAMPFPVSLASTFKESGREEQDEEIRSLMEQIAVAADGNISIAKSLIAEACFSITRLYNGPAGGEQEGGRTADEIMDGIRRLNNLEEACRYIRSYVDETGDQPGRSRTVYSQNVKKAVEFIRSHYAKTLNLSLVARELNVNPSYLSRILSQETGSSFVELVAKARIEAAKRLLREGQYRVNEVCELVGYKEYNYFYQIFKKYTGMTPTDYKNEEKG